MKRYPYPRRTKRTRYLGRLFYYCMYYYCSSFGKVLSTVHTHQALGGNDVYRVFGTWSSSPNFEIVLLTWRSCSPIPEGMSSNTVMEQPKALKAL